MNGVFHGHLLIQDEIEVRAGFGQLLFVEQIVHHDPRLGVVKRVVRAQVAGGGVVLHRKEVGKGQPDLGAQQFGKRLGGTSFFLIAEQVLAERGSEFGVAAEFDLFVVDANGAEIFGESFVKPSLRGGIVVVQQHGGEVVGDGAPGFFFEQIEDDKVLIVAGEEEAGDIDWLAPAQGRDLIKRLVILKGEDGQWDGLIETLSAEQGAEHGAHLLEAECDFSSSLVAGVGDDGEVRGVDFEPGGRFGRGGGDGEQEQAAQRGEDTERDETGAGHLCRREGEASGKCYHDSGS